jgi:uncharacterized membrane protein
MTLAMTGVTPGEAGLASGLVNTTMQVGGALGLAVLATLSSTRTAHLLATGASHASALTSGYHLAWVLSASLAAAALLIGTSVLRSARRGTEADTASTEQDLPEFEQQAIYAEAT